MSQWTYLSFCVPIRMPPSPIKTAMPKSLQQSVSAKSSILLFPLLLVFLFPGMALHGGIHFGLSWLRRGCFGLESRALCASQGFSLVKLNSFLFSSNPFHPPRSNCSSLILRLNAPRLPGNLVEAPFQAFSCSDNFTLLRLIFSHILMN